MSVKVQKYLLNVAKSVAYSTADVLSEKFTYPRDFKNENREVFNNIYHSVKDYRTTFSRLKKTITNNKIVDAARVGFDSIVYSVTTGDFYAKNKETEVTEKYSGSFMAGMDIDDEDFDFEKRDDVSEGDMVIATAVKKNSKIQTAITSEAIVKTGKAQMDVSKENTMLLYTQNERLMNKLDGNFANITTFLKQRDEEAAKVQNKMNENINKFMTNVDNNVAKITAQLDEMLEMQRNMYKPVKQEEKKREGFDDIIDRSGVINLKAYGARVKKQAVDTLLESIPGANMIFGDMFGEGTNMLAAFAANPLRALTTSLINKGLGKKFDAAARDLNKTLENAIPDLMGRLVAEGRNEDGGFGKILGKILGIKSASAESVNTNNYNKGAMPFDGITRKAIIDVIPYYLRKMTSAMTGGEEMTFDYSTGRWTSMKTAKRQYDTIVNAELDSISTLLKGILRQGTGRDFDSMYATIEARNKANDAVKSLARSLSSTGDFSSIKESDLNSEERALWTAIKTAMRRDASRKEGDIWIDGRSAGADGTGGKVGTLRRRGPSLSGFNSSLRSIRNSSNSSIKQLNENGGLAMLAAMEELNGDIKDYHGKSYVDSNGDMSSRRIQELPTAQVLLRAKDEYGKSLFNYIRDIGHSTKGTFLYSQYLRTLPFIYNNVGPIPPTNGTNVNIPNINVDEEIKNGDVDYKAGADSPSNIKYYEELRKKEKDKERDSHKNAVERAKEKARKKGDNISFATTAGEFRGEGNDIGISRIMSDFEMDYEAHAIEEDRKEKERKEKEKWKKREEILGKETTDKLRKAEDEFDSAKGLRENMGKVKDTPGKLYMIAKWINQKTQVNAMDKISDTIIKTDAWLKNLLYGNELKPDEEKLGLWQNIKNHTQKFFDWTKDTISEKIVKPIQKLYDNSWLQKGLRKIFGVVDSEGNIEEEGLLSHFTAGFRKAMHKNADDVRKIYQEEARKAKEAAERAGIIKSNEDESSSSSSSSSSSGSSGSNIPTPTQQNSDKFRLKSQSIKNQIIRDYNKYSDSDIDYIRENAIEKMLGLNTYLKRQSSEGSMNWHGSNRTDADAEARKNELIVNIQKDINRELSWIGVNAERFEVIKDELLKQNNPHAKRIVKMQKRLENIKKSKINLHHMATGGVNLTGRAFKSVLSAGEKVYTGTGVSKISHMGVYNIPDGAVVVNPASASTRAKQATAEHKFARGLRYNANANDGLTETTPNEETEEEKKKREEAKRKHEEAKARIEQVDISKLTDWRTLTDDKQRAAFLGSMASRGVIGGVAGLLVGGPLLGAAVGAASSLSKSTDSFSEFIFGEVEKDKDGNIILDNKGRPKRKANSGLISKELQDAAPDMSKLGLVGLGAGLLTGLGPLAGLLLGSGMGFAKHTEAFQGTVFGEGGIFSDENIGKLKKGAKNMGIGAATAALFLPGPFGLVGSALIGATAGYATSTDKFKDFLLGKENEDGKRRGGVKGAIIDNVVNPLKGFGRTIVDKTLDEIFGPEGEDGERNTDKGLFGAIRTNVIGPLTSGAQSIFKEVTNTLSDIKDFAINIFKNIRDYTSGNSFISGLWEKATKVGSGVIGLAGKAGRLATKPFRIFGDEGIGGALKKKRIRKGRADDMTARERLNARGKFGMAAEDEWTGFDNLLVDLDAQGRKDLQTILDFDANSKDIDKARIGAYKELGQGLRNIISTKDTKKIIRMIKDGRIKDVERYLRRRKIGDSQIEDVLRELSVHKNKMDKAEEIYQDMNAKGMTTQRYLQEHNVNIDITNPRKLKNLKLMLNREIAHDEVGLTEEELAWQEEKNFWTGVDSPLKTVNAATSNMERMLEMIHYDLTIGSNYDKLSDEEKAKYGSKEDYINKIKGERANNAIIKAASNDKFSVGKFSRIGKLDVKSLKMSDALTNDLYNDYLPVWTADLKNAMLPDDRVKNLLSTEFDELIQTACEMFDGLALKELCVAERIKDDITTYTAKIAKKENCTEEEARTKIKTMRRKITIVRNDKPYEFEMSYTIGADGTTVNPNKRQPNSYDNTKREFIEDYLADHKPKTFEASYMSFGDIVSNSLKLGWYLKPVNVPGIPLINANAGGLLVDTINTYGKKVLKAFPKVARKIGFEVSGLVNNTLGSHDLNNKSFIQEHLNLKYNRQAEIEWDKEKIKYKNAYDIIYSNHSMMSEEELADFNENVAPKFKEEMLLLDTITKNLGLGDRFGELNDEQQEQVRSEFIRMYVEAKKNGQLFGRGLLGNIKTIGKHIAKSKLGKAIKFTVGVGKILFNGGANEGNDKEERKALLIASLTKKAEYAWSQLFTLARDDNGNLIKNKYDDNLGDYELEPKEEIVKLVHELYDKKYQANGADALWSNLTKEERAMIHDTFISRFVQGRYQKLMSPLLANIGKTLVDKARNWAYLKIKTIGDKAIGLGRAVKNKVKNKVASEKAYFIRKKVWEHALKHDRETLNSIAIDKYSVNFDELDDMDKTIVLNIYYDKYYSDVTSVRGAISLKLKDRISGMKTVSRLSSAMGTLKEGVKNSVQGKLDKVKEWKEKNQERDTLIGRFFDIMDARKLKKDKEKFEGKRDSKISKIIKWLFVGGVAVPLVVGVLKKDIMPAIKEKISPWLKKAKDKIFGVKDEKTGEYKGGIISGIVNPIRNFFKTKFEKVHNWIHNEGPYTSDDTGLRGFWKGLTKVGSYLIDRWKIGIEAVYGAYVPKLLHAIGSNIVPVAIKIGKGLVDYVVAALHGERGLSELSLDKGSNSFDVSSKGTTTTIPTSVGGSITAKTEGVNIKNSIPPVDVNGFDITKTKNADGSTTYSNDKGATATTKKDNEVYYAGKNKNGEAIYKDKKTNKAYYQNSEGQFVPYTDYQEVFNPDLMDNEKFQELQEAEANNQLGTTADYTTSAEGKVTGGLLRAGLNNAATIAMHGTQGARAFNAGIKIATAPAQILKTTVLGKPVAWATKKVSNLAQKANLNLAERAGKLSTGMTNLVSRSQTLAKFGAKDLVRSLRPEQIKNLASMDPTKAATAAQRKIIEASQKAAAKLEMEAFENADKLAVQEMNAASQNGGGLIKKAINWLKGAVNKIKDIISKVLKNEKVAKILGKKVTENADDVAENIAKGVADVAEQNADDLAKMESKAAVKGAGKFLSIVMIVANFLLGMDNCRNILGIAVKNPSLNEKIVGGMINIIPDVLMTAGQLVIGATAGVGTVVGGILIGISLLSMLLLMLPKTRNAIVNSILNALDAIGFDVSNIKEDREKTAAVIDEFNHQYQTNISIEEYNKMMNYTSKTEKAMSGIANGWSATFGYDADTKHDIADATAGLDEKGVSNDVREKLVSVFSEIWQLFGEKYFNYKIYDEDGNTLSGKQKLIANNQKFKSCAENIIIELNSVLIQQKERVIREVKSNASEFKGPLDARFNLKNTFNYGADNPLTQFDVDDKHIDWKRIKAIAGVCAVINDIFFPCNCQAKITEIVVHNMMPVYFSNEELNKIEENNPELDTSKYRLDTSNIDEAPTTTDNVEESEDTATLPTNANTNDKLTPIKGTTFKNRFNIQESVSEAISNAIASMTGGKISNIGEVINNLRRKNKQINQKIDSLRILPTDNEYWNIEIDKDNPFASSLFSFTENISRVIKAPFSLAASMNMNTASILSSNAGVTSGATVSNTKSNNNSSTSSNNNQSKSTASSTKNNSALSKMWNGFKSAVKAVTGKGKGDSDNTDPYHIYQRDFSDKYNTYGDSEYQSLADSGCGPASAASVLRMYGKDGDMKNAANFALRNKYKEKDGGTYPEYFNDYLSSNGISTNSNATNADVINNLVNGKPVILMGKNTHGDKSTPYGNKYSHYVVAKGIDANGNVIVEDSEDKRGNTKYSLADTLKNTSVRITTGSGKYGRASDDMSVSDRYISNVNAVISTTVGSVIAAAINGANVNTGSTNTSSSSSKSDDTNYGNINGDAKAAIGKSYTATLEGETMTLTMDKGGAEIYTFLTDECGCSTAAACGVMGNWVQECGGHTIENIKPVALKGQITYGGGLMQWTPPDSHIAWANQHGYSDPWEWEAQLAHVKDELSENSTDWSTTRIGNYADQMRAQGFSVCNTTSEFKALTDPEDAAVNFERGLEGSADFDGRSAEGPIYYAHLYDFNRRLAALAVYGLVTGKSDSKSGKGKSLFGKGRSKFGRAEETTTNTETKPVSGPLTFDKMMENKFIEKEANKEIKDSNFIGPMSEDQVRDGTEEAEAVKEAKDIVNNKTSSSNNASSSEAKGLLSLLGKYAKKLTKGIYGSFYDALYGYQPTTNTGTTSDSNSSSASYNGTDVVYAAAMVFEALSKANPNAIYDNSCATTFDIECRDGTKIEHVRPDCSGVMTAVLQYMGYYTYRSGKEYSETYHGEGLNDQHMRPEDIYDKEGNPTKDFEVLQPSEALGDKAQPGDIRVESGHTDMFCWYIEGSEWPKGFNAGSPDGMRDSYALAKEYFDNGNKLPIGSQTGAGTIRDASCTWVLRYKGTGSGRAKEKNKKANIARLNSLHRPKNFMYSDRGVVYNSSVKSKFGRGIWGRDGEETTETKPVSGPLTFDKMTEKKFIEKEANKEIVNSDFIGPTNEDQVRDGTEEAEAVKEAKDIVNNKTTTTSSSNNSAKTLISKLTTYAKKAIKGVYGDFYNALYGNENTQTVNEDNNDNAAYNGGDVIYAAAMVSEAFGKAMVASGGYIYDAWGGHYFDLECRDGTKLKHERPDCSGLMSAVMHYMGYYTIRPGINTTMGSGDYHGEGWGTQAWNEGHSRTNECVYDADGNLSKDWIIIDYDPNDKRPGDIRLMDGHTQMYINSDASGNEYGFNGGSEDAFEESQKLAEYFFDNNNQIPDSNTISCINDSRVQNGVIRFVGKSGSGRGKNSSKKKEYNTATVNGIRKTGMKPPIKTLGNAMKTGKAKSITELTDNYSYSGHSLPSLSTNRHNTTTSRLKNTNSMPSTPINNTYSNDIENKYSNNNNIDLTEIIKLIATIANNSEKMDSLLTILETIAVNTENTSNNTKTTNQSNNKANTPKNGLAALRNALNNNDNGQDIINAIYQIAKS